jgi:hypothetical protein
MWDSRTNAMRSPLWLPAVWLTVIVLAAAGPGCLAAQSGSETIRGQVTTDSGRVVPGASVRVTRAPDRAYKLATTDQAGNYSVVFEEGTGDYLVHVDAPGWRTVRRRVTRAGGDPVVVADVKLESPRTVQLQAVVVTSQRTPPPRAQDTDAGPGAAERMVDGVPGALSPEQEGDLAAVAATVPGGSVVGVSPGQNQITLNGLAFAAGDIPREARTRIRVSNSTYDPSRGGFSGTQTAVELATGGIYTFRRAHVTIDAPPLQGADEVSEGLGSRYTSLQLSAGGDGELVEDRFYHNFSAQASRRMSGLATLGSASPEVLRSVGLAADSVTRLLALLDDYGVPLRRGGAAQARSTESFSFLGRIDHTPRSSRTWGVTAYGKVTRSGGVGAGPTVTLASGGETSRVLGALQGHHSFYFRKYFLNETRSSFTYGADQGEPYLRLPAGRVLVASDFGASRALGRLGFGGDGTLEYDRRAWTWETTNETQWQTWANTHRVKVYLQSRVDGYSRSAGGSLGTFDFASLADLAANRPASFTRRFGDASTEGAVWSGAAAVGDLWRVSPTLQLLYGLRLEGNRYLSGAPASNPLVRSAFGTRNDALPNSVHLSPRLGFTWVYSGPNSRASMTTTTLATQYRGPRGSIRGGIGEFRGLLPADLGARAAISTGLSGLARSVSCVGPAVPTPDWEAYASDPALVPSACEPGGESPSFADGAPEVQLVNPSYQAPRSWRGNLAWVSALGRHGFSIDGVFSVGLNQPGTSDLNFAGIPQFTLADEGGRPVFVRPESIVPETGATTGSDARRDPQFGRVVRLESDLRVVSRQVTLVLNPEIANRRYFANFAYTVGSARAQYRGFDGAAFGSPVEPRWAPSDFDVRHQVQFQAGLGARLFSLSLLGRFASGTPFTPLVAGDVNGDGVWNDRAFVFHPDALPDAAGAPAMRTLLQSGPEWARGCLERALGRPAARNSCRGPWTQSLNARLALTRRLPYTRNRVEVALNVANALSGVDLLLHGSRGFRGWGNPVRPDPVLYRVRGFDPEAQRFRYDVNPRFGDTRAASRLLGTPFRVTIDARVDLGRPLQLQQLERYLRPGRAGRPGTRPSVDSLITRYTRSVPDIYAMTLQLSDSLLLAPTQVEALQGAQAAYNQRMNAVWRELAEYLAALPDAYDPAEALRRQEAAIDQGWDITRLEGPALREILSPLQLRMLPSLVDYVINAKGKITIRYYMG